MAKINSYNLFLASSRKETPEQVIENAEPNVVIEDYTIQTATGEKPGIPAPSWTTTTNMDNDPQPEIVLEKEDEPEDE